jgi:hypothetical protein
MIDGQRIAPADQHMIGPRNAMHRKHFAHYRTESPLYAIAHHGIAQLLGGSNPEPRIARLILARLHDQHERRHGDTHATIGGEEFGPFGQAAQGQAILPVSARRLAQADSLARPRARRARSTARPPTVAVRARKPWRRARTRLLGWKVRFIGLLSNLK